MSVSTLHDGRYGQGETGPTGARTGRIFAHHDNVDLGGPALARIARDYGLRLDELRRSI
jgi:hypothetical protein